LNAARFVRKCLVVLAGAVCVYLGAIAALSCVDLGDFTAIERLNGNAVRPGNRGFSLARFREADASGSVDVLFVGSSHAYMSFDPRAYRAAGLRAFNLGSSGQSPFNSYFLLKRYLPRMRPHVVVFEGYFRVFEGDGLEGFYDAVHNATPSKEILEMALVSRNPNAITAAIAQWFVQARKPLALRRQQTFPWIRYIEGGYCEMLAEAGERPYVRRGAVRLSEKQKRWFRRALRLAIAAGARPVVVVQPNAKGFTASLEGYREANRQIEEIAREEGAAFVDFEDALDLSDAVDFVDSTHLSASGSRKLNAALLDVLRKEDFV
jgi:hypothetical protein